MMNLFLEYVGYKIGTKLGCNSFRGLSGGSYSMEDAIGRCDSLPSCKAIRNWKCLGNTYYLCKSTYKRPSSQKCLYVKGNHQAY